MLLLNIVSVAACFVACLVVWVRQIICRPIWWRRLHGVCVFFFGPFWTLSHWFLCSPLFDCYFAVCRRQTLEGAATHYTSFPTLHEGLARSWGCYELIKQFCSFTNAVWNTIKLFIEAIVKFKTHHYLKHDKKIINCNSFLCLCRTLLHFCPSTPPSAMSPSK